MCNLGDVLIDRGDNERAVQMHTIALAIGLRLEAPDAAKNIDRLSTLRDRIGIEAFEAMLSESLDEESRSNLLALLDRYDQSQHQGTAT